MTSPILNNWIKCLHFKPLFVYTLENLQFCMKLCRDSWLVCQKYRSIYQHFRFWWHTWSHIRRHMTRSSCEAVYQAIQFSIRLFPRRLRERTNFTESFMHRPFFQSIFLLRLRIWHRCKNVADIYSLCGSFILWSFGHSYVHIMTTQPPKGRILFFRALSEPAAVEQDKTRERIRNKFC